MIGRYINHIIGGFKAWSGEMSLWEELWAYLEGKYFSVDLGRYEHINVGSGSLITLRNVILGICAGIIIASIMAAYDKNMLGKFVRKIIKEECFWPDKAKTLEELGFEKNYFIMSSLRRGNGILGKVVKCVEREEKEIEALHMRQEYIEATGSEKGFVQEKYEVDLNTAHFYIPDDEHYAADIRFDNKGSGWRAFLLVIIVTLIIAVLVCFLLPDMIQLVDNMIDILKGDGNVVG